MKKVQQVSFFPIFSFTCHSSLFIKDTKPHCEPSVCSLSLTFPTPAALQGLVCHPLLHLSRLQQLLCCHTAPNHPCHSGVGFTSLLMTLRILGSPSSSSLDPMVPLTLASGKDKVVRLLFCLLPYLLIPCLLIR